MTPAQLKALERYVQAVCYHMANHVNAPGSGLREYRAARDNLESVFGISLPPVDLFAPQPPAMPDLL